MESSRRKSLRTLQDNLAQKKPQNSTLLPRILGYKKPLLRVHIGMVNQAEQVGY